MLKPNPKTVARKETFRKITDAISRDYHSGYESEFEIKGRPVQDRELTSRTGPKMKTQQWERTVRKN